VGYPIIKSTVILLTAVVPAFSSCEYASNTPKPQWLNGGYSIPGYHVGIGTAESSGKTAKEQRDDSENDAKKHLTEEIEVKIVSNFEDKFVVSNNIVDKYASHSLTSKAELVLNNLKVQDRWTDKTSCTMYTLVMISNEEASKAIEEKKRKNNIEDSRKALSAMKVLIAMGTDKNKYKEPKTRKGYIEEAQSIYNTIQFDLLNEMNNKPVYSKRMSDTILGINNEISQSKGRIALFAINPDGKIPSEVIGKMLDMLRASNTKADRLMVTCSAATECMDKAKEGGFELLTWLKIDGRVETTSMGALKGTIAVSKTDYDVINKRIINKPANASSQVLGWGNDQINWDIAAEKAIEDLH